MTTQFNRIALEGAINTLREAYGANMTNADNEAVVDFVGWAAWNFGTRAEAVVRLEQAAITLARMIEAARSREDLAPFNPSPTTKKRIKVTTNGNADTLRDGVIAHPQERD